jgi:predicted ABC-type transport system involved in lysophospholipase L1 biosynthesis ATPase subunit
VTGFLLELSDVSKDYHGLRPLRIERLALSAGDQIAIIGLDRPAAEIFINLVTGATLPDRGDIRAFGRSTTAIQDSADWLATVDRFAIVSPRAVLLDQLSVGQNLAIPYSLDIEPLPEAVASRARALSSEVGLDEALWTRQVAEVDRAGRLRIRLGRALALDPDIAVLEHPTADLDAADIAAVGRDFRAIIERRGLAALTLTADRAFADAIAPHVLTLDPATGRLTERRRGWFRRA